MFIIFKFLLFLTINVTGFYFYLKLLEFAHIEIILISKLTAHI